MHLSLSIRNRLMEYLPVPLNVPASLLQTQPVGGGSINKCFQLTVSGQHFFCKINSATKFPHLFQTEATGLAVLEKQKLVRTPQVIEFFEEEDQQILLLEWIQSGERTEAFWKTFGQQLAALHAHTADYYGLTENNYMGSVPQINQPTDSWINFFAKHRLQPLIEKCYSKDLLTTKHLSSFEQLYARLPQIFNEEKPALLHGDLWSGNFMCSENNLPVLIDPAVYFGHRSVDLAMTTLFGGFRRGFYEAYQYHYPYPANYEEQWPVCNLYPLLIHLLLFGKSYLSQINNTLSHFG